MTVHKGNISLLCTLTQIRDITVQNKIAELPKDGLKFKRYLGMFIHSHLKCMIKKSMLMRQFVTNLPVRLTKSIYWKKLATFDSLRSQ